MKRRAIELGSSLSSFTKVYLDKRFWILLRDASIGRSTCSAVDSLLNSLRLAVQKGDLICPISGSIFFELLKQEDIKTRRSTAELIDNEIGSLYRHELKSREFFPLLLLQDNTGRVS